jgi:hypothetical protein
MATKIIPKKSSVDDKVPLTTDLDVGEIAINLADKKLFTKDGADNIISLGNTEEQRIPIKADVALSKGDVLYATGAVGASGKITVDKYIANNTIDEIYLIGLADRDLSIGEIGYAISFGEIKKIDTTGTAVSETWVDGTILYASPTTAGKLTNVQPDAPNQDITTAIVIRAHANTGILFIRPKQGYHLDEIHDVYAPSPTDGQVLSWNNTNSRWEAATVEGGGGTTGASITASDTPPSSPSAGDLWFNTSDMSLSVYYQDADSSQWVITSGPQGAAGVAGADGQDTTVTASSTAPSNPEQGDLWFNTTDSSMYFYDSGQWVAISGPTGPEGPEGPAGEGISTGKAIAMAIVFG